MQLNGTVGSIEKLPKTKKKKTMLFPISNNCIFRLAFALNRDTLSIFKNISTTFVFRADKNPINVCSYSFNFRLILSTFLKFVMKWVFDVIFTAAKTASNNSVSFFLS